MLTSSNTARLLSTQRGIEPGAALTRLLNMFSPCFMIICFKRLLEPTFWEREAALNPSYPKCFKPRSLYSAQFTSTNVYIFAETSIQLFCKWSWNYRSGLWPFHLVAEAASFKFFDQDVCIRVLPNSFPVMQCDRSMALCFFNPSGIFPFYSVPRLNFFLQSLLQGKRLAVFCKEPFPIVH